MRSLVSAVVDALQGPVRWIESADYRGGIEQQQEGFVATTLAIQQITREDCEEFIMAPPQQTTVAIISYTGIIAVVSTAALLYLQWQNVPAWMKLWAPKKKKTQGGTRDGGDDDDADCDMDANDHLASIPAVLEKLSQMMNILDRVDTTQSTEGKRHGFDDVNYFAALYSLLHLYTEIETKDPDYRERLYDEHDDQDDVGLEEVQELAEYLEYAHWAYQKSPIEQNCKNSGLDLISQDIATEPGRVGHYVACRHSEKLVIIGLKGTSTFSDILTDLIAIPKEHLGCYFDDKTFAAPKEGSRDLASAAAMFCHEGIFTAAIWMADHLQSMIENLFVPLNYKVVICGHSLGAGTACLLGLELRSRIAAFRKNYTDLRVLAFATPPVLSYKASLACAPFVTSVVNNADVITRCSIANLAVMDKLLLKVHNKLVEKGLRVDSWQGLKKYYEEHSIVDDDLLLTETELDEFFQETHKDPEKEREALFVPGRVIALWDKGENDNYEMGGIITNGGMKMLRQFEFRATMITDHLVNMGYRPNIRKLLNQLESDANPISPNL